MSKRASRDQTARPRARRRELLLDSAFRRYFLARLISFGGTTVTTVALPVLVYQRTGSALQTSLLLTVQTVPYLLLGLLAGAVADRGNRKRIMVVCNLVNLLLLGSVPLAAAFDVLTLAHIYGAALGTATCFVWFDAANFGALPALVGRDRVIDAKSIMWSVDGVVIVLGPALAGVLIATVGPALTLSVDAASYAASALILMSIRRPFRGESAVASTGSTASQIREGLQFLWRHRVIRALTLTGVGNSFAGGAMLGLLVVYAVEQLGLPSDDARIGLLFTAGALGSLMAGVSLPQLVRLLPAPRITLMTLMASFLFLMALSITTELAVALVIYFSWTACYSLTILNGIAYRQRVVPDHLQGRVNVVARMVAWGGQPFGAAIGGAIGGLTDIRTALLISSVALLVSAVAGWFTVLRTDPGHT